MLLRLVLLATKTKKQIFSKFDFSCTPFGKRKSMGCF